jgi:hypothetical protein
MLASKELIDKRLRICNGCVNLFKPTGNCKLCGCFVKVKTKLKNQKCPIEKW